MDQKLDIGSIISQAFAIVSRNFAPFLGVAAVVIVPGLALTNWSTYDMTRRQLAGEADPFRGILVMILGTIIYALSVQLANAALVYGVFRQLRDQPVSLGDCLARAFSSLGRVIGVAIVVGLLTAMGSLLCLVPGLMLMTMWYIAIPCSVIEGTGVSESMRRSSMLTSGNRLRIFLIILLLGLLLGGIQLICTFVLIGHQVVAMIVQDGWIVVGTAFGATASSLVYFNLRRMKESEFDVEQLATVFD